MALKEASIYLTTNIFNKATPFLLLPILTRYLSPTEFGLMEMFMVTSSLVGIIVGLGGQGAVSRAYFDLPDKEELACYTGTTFIIAIGTFVIMFVVCLVLHKPISEITHLTLGWLWVALLFMLSKCFTITNLSLWRMEKKPISYGLYLLPQTFGDISLSVFLVAVLCLGWQGRLIGLVTTAVGFSLLSYWILRRRGYLRWHWNTEHARSMMRFCVPLVPHRFAGWITGSLDLIIIGKFVGVGGIGVYAVSVTLAKAILLVVESFAQAWTPHVYFVLSNDSENNTTLIYQSYIYMIALALIGIGYVIVAPYFFQWFVGLRYQNSLKYLPCLVTAYVMQGWYRIFAVYIFYSKRTEFVALVTIVSGVIHIALLFVLVNYYGIMGAAITIVCSSFITFALIAWMSSRVWAMPWLSVWTSRKSVR